jgi:alkanesulfonate monooxygenase SsuD/methylene tetrahydromethanopterin reductase-like flavin-dependent oxidoreductase (luciferase family)
MALTNSERQARWRTRLKEAAAAAGADPDQGAENAALRVRVAELEAELDRKKKNFNQWLVTGRKGLVFSKNEFDLVLHCLHPDGRAGLSDMRLAEAFRLFNSRKPVLCKGAKPKL